ncbi:MAG: hypothetical protein CSB55_05510 [Candidatus Cloacimonadota bacterium]|nr:MAG: hypothetical protein CSB55_05510 [Candidatus Cloacimonadota bacterium]
MLKKIIKYALLSAVVLLLGCEADSQSVNSSDLLIRTILDKITTDFNNSNYEEIMSYYADDFLHNGKTKDHVFSEWQSYYVNFDYMETENIEIDIDYDEAVVSFRIEFSSSDETQVFTEPYDNGFMSYFKKINGEWMIYGNRESGNSIVGFPFKIASNPPGAQIYFDNNRIFQQTPVMLQDIPSGDHKIRLFLPGYNETEVSVNVPGQLSVDLNLSHPNYPYAEFYDFSPGEDQVVEHNFYVITGLLRLKKSDNHTDLFPGGEIILNLNGQETSHSLLNGQFRAEVNLRAGTNRYFLRCSDPEGNTGMSEVISFEAEF